MSFSDGQSICRGCMFDSSENEALFDKTEDTENQQQLTTVGRLLAECLSVEITPTDCYPRTICVHCKGQLQMYDEFRTSVLRIHRHFTRRLNRTRTKESAEAHRSPFWQIESETAQEPVIDDVADVSSQAYTDYNGEDKNDEGLVVEVLLLSDEQTHPDQFEYIDYKEAEANNEQPTDEPMVEVYLEESFLRNSDVKDGDDDDDHIVEEQEDNAETYLTLSQDGSIRSNSCDNESQTDGKKHTARLSSNNDIQCDTCQRIFKEALSFRFHCCLPYGAGRTQFKCPGCDERMLCDQIQAHLSRRPDCKRSCSVPITYTSKAAVIVPSRGKRKVVPSPASALHAASPRKIQRKAFHCKRCSGTFPTERALSSHICTIAGKCRYRCHICENTFKTLGSLDEHMLRHSGQRNFACEDCPKSFKTPTDLYVHKKIHTETFRKYVCDVCGYACRSTSHLANHVITHSDQRPFNCAMCEKAFKRKDMLDGHILSLHSNKTEHVCFVCDASFGLKQRLQRHLKIHVRKGEI